MNPDDPNDNPFVYFDEHPEEDPFKDPSLLSMRKHVELTYGLIVPDGDVLMDSPDYFSYQHGNGPIVAWNRNKETLWRNSDRKT